MKSNHTPAPWSIGDENNLYIEICIGDAVANLGRQDRYGLHMAFSLEQMRANARLIAAAPELLEVLSEMVEMVDIGDEHGFGSEWHIKAKAAIAKAIGAQA